MATLVTGAFDCSGAWARRRRLDAGEKPLAFDGGEQEPAT